MGVDKFGREHFVVEAPAGRLGILLVENECGFVVVQGFGEVDQGDSSEMDKEGLAALRKLVREGDRLVAIDGGDVAHSGLSEVIVRLGKLSAKKRCLKFARYHAGQHSIKNYDPEKLVLVRAPNGPLGLILNDTARYGAIIEGFQQLPDGSDSYFKSYKGVHQGCQIVNVNGVDVSKLSREEVTKVLAEMKEQDKEIVLYRMAPSSCTRILKVEASSEDVTLSFAETDNFRCVLASIGGTVGNEVVEGDIMIGINSTDITTMGRLDAMKLLGQTPFPKLLTFYHPKATILPECHALQIDAGPSGLNLDSSDSKHAKISGFTTPADADRPTCKELKDFVPGSYIIAINGLEVHHHTLENISKLFSKLRHAAKQIVVANLALLECVEQFSDHVKISVSPGPLGVQFDGGQDGVARVAGYNPMSCGRPGVIEQSRCVPIGSILQSINKLNVSCLTLGQTVGLLQKLSSVPKELAFLTCAKDIGSNSRTVSIRVPPGPLGIDLETSSSKKVVVSRVNDDPTRGPTHIFNHGGVVDGAEILAIEGFDVSTLQIAELSQILRLFASHEKVITFGSTTAAYENMFNKPSVKHVVVSKSPMGIEFDSSLEYAACTTNVARGDSSDEISVGSRLIAIDSVDVRALSLNEIIAILKDLAGIQKTLTFDSDYHQTTLTPSSILVLSTRDATKHTSSTSDVPQLKPVVRFANVDTTEESPKTKASQVRPPPLQISSTVPVPLSALSIRTVEATNPSAEVGGSTTKQQFPSNSLTFMITMASWSGSRSSSRLVVDKLNKCLHIEPLNASSPRAAKTSVIAFSDISVLDIGKTRPASTPKKGLFRSLSSSKDIAERYTVVISATKTSKSSGKQKTKVWEFEMLSNTERDALEGIILT